MKDWTIILSLLLQLVDKIKGLNQWFDLQKDLKEFEQATKDGDVEKLSRMLDE